MQRDTIESVEQFSAPGLDRENARAIWAQASHRAHPLSTVQVEHLLQIGYSHGRRTMLQEVNEALAADRAAEARPRGWRRLVFRRSSHAQNGA